MTFVYFFHIFFEFQTYLSIDFYKPIHKYKLSSSIQSVNICRDQVIVKEKQVFFIFLLKYECLSTVANTYISLLNN